MPGYRKWLVENKTLIVWSNLDIPPVAYGIEGRAALKSYT